VLIETPIEFGGLDYVPTDTLLGLPAAKLFKLVTALDENPHTLRGFLRLVARVLAAPCASVTASRPIFARLREGSIAEAARSIRAERRAQLATFRPRLAGVPDHAVRRLLRDYVPTGLSDGRLLHYAANCTLSHTPVGLAIQRLQNFEMGYGQLRRQPVHALRTLCAELGIDEIERLDFRDDASPDATSPGADDALFERPVFIWALSAFPRTHLPELLGAALVQYAARLPPLLVAFRERVEELGRAAASYFDVDSLDTATTPQLDVAIEAAERLLEPFSDGASNPVAERVAVGAAVSWELTDRWTRAMWSLVPKEDEAATRVGEIMASRRFVAAGYHKRVKLGRKSLDELLSPERFDAPAFLDALARSRYVVPGNAAASRLIREMVSLDGAMFRVFSEDEIAAISAWIDGLPQAGAAAEVAGRDGSPASQPALWRDSQPDVRHPGSSPAADRCRWWDATPPALETIATYSALPTRTVIRRLLDLEKHPDVRVFANHYITECLSKARALFRPETGAKVELPPGDPLTHDFFHLRPYTPEYLESQLALQAKLQKEGHESWKRQRTYPPREQVQQDLAMGIPAGLIDGAWLQYIAASELLHDASTSYLYTIYDDELGNGVDRQHHGNILRRLLDQAGIEQPDILSSDFSACEKIYSDENCVIALLWLCISLFPKRLRPETLGFNLGVESWGVGGAFRTSEATLRHHGLDPLFPRLHNAIDNYAEGHTGWSKEAVHRYLASAFRAGGEPLRQLMWERIWNGYSLWSARHQLSLERGPPRM
jgi:hypothetical protein